MLKNCRVCCETTKGTNAKNLFDSKQSILLHHIELLTGEWLTYKKHAPTHICNCCEQDLKVAAALRERCIKTQRILRNRNICSSPTSESINEIKFEGNLIDENQYSEIDSYADYLLDYTEEEQVNDIIDDEDFDEEDYNLFLRPSNIREEEFPSIEYETELDVQHVDSPNRTSPEPPIETPAAMEQRNIYDCRVSKEKAKGKIFICHQCGRCFNDSGNLKLHLIRHSGIKNYECEVCKAKFYSSYLLKRHSVIHTSTPPTFACQYCGKTFIYNNYRRKHERLHFKERRFHCQSCDKSFFTKRQQKDHQVVHTRIRKYNCELCDQYFLRKTHLKAHCRSKNHKNMEQQKKKF